MEDEKAKVLNQVKKMFALAGNNPSQEEADAAMAKAQELLCKHSLSRADVELIGEQGSPEAVDIAAPVEVGRSVPRWQKAILPVIANNLKCEYYLHRLYGVQRIKIIGLEEDAEVCASTLGFVFRHFLNAWARFLKYEMSRGADSSRRKTNEKKIDFIRGFVEGLRELFSKNIEEKGLIIVKSDTVIEKMRSINCKMVNWGLPSTQNDEVAITAGYNAGKHAPRGGAGTITQGGQE